MMTISVRRRLESVEHSLAVEEIGGNEDLVRVILLHLPVRSLLRFKSVSEKWLSLISYPYFAQSYTRRHNPNSKPSGLLLNHEDAEFQFIPFKYDGDQARVRLMYPNDPTIMILQSCNGLLMCSSTCFVCRFKHYICNPTTKEFSIVPFPHSEFEDVVVAVNLAFDPLKSPHYKLLCVWKVNELQTSRTYQIHIYSSETRTWRPPTSALGNPLIFIAPNGIGFNDAIYCNGAIHWYSCEETSLYFDTDAECLKTMPMPPFQEGLNFHKVCYFGESRGHLHLIVIGKFSDTRFDILELEKDYSGWFIRYCVNLNAVTTTFPRRIRNFSVLCVARAEKEEESTLVLFVSGKAISFNLNDKTSKKLCDLVRCRRRAAGASDYQWSDAYQYIETLFRV